MWRLLGRPVTLVLQPRTSTAPTQLPNVAELTNVVRILTETVAMMSERIDVLEAHTHLLRVKIALNETISER